MTQRSFNGLPPEVLVMAGGEGRRLGALAARTPKPMLPVDGRPVLQHILEQLREQGVEHVFLSVRHLSHVISGYFGDGRWLGIDIDYLVEGEALGTAGAIGSLPTQSKPLLVHNGDVMTPVPITAVAAHHQEHGAAMTIACTEQRLSIPYGVIECVGPDVLRMHEKPDVILTVIAGIYLIAPEVAAGVHRGVPLSMPDLIKAVLPTGRVVGFPLPGPWLDIGTPDSYALAEHVSASTATAPQFPVIAGARESLTSPVFAGVVPGDRNR
jgi:NDP-sugar pyrophosphorylase family protein